MIFQLDVPIYNTNVLFIVNPTSEEIQEFLDSTTNKEKLTDEELKNLLKELDDVHYGGYTTWLDKGGYIVLLKEDYKIPSIYQHELFHVTNLILFDRGIEHTRIAEPYAYLIGWITEQYIDYISKEEIE